MPNPVRAEIIDAFVLLDDGGEPVATLADEFKTMHALPRLGECVRACR